jgi:hypothetical protein
VNPKLIRLVLAGTLFVAWMGYLGYLVYALPRPPKGIDLPIVLSRPQFLVSEVDVIGTVNGQDGTVTVTQVLYPPNADKPETGKEIKVTNLDEVKDDTKRPLSEKSSLGPCLLPLQTSDNGLTYQVVHVPPSPGFFTHGDARIYPANDETIAEYHQIHKPEPRPVPQP